MTLSGLVDAVLETCLEQPLQELPALAAKCCDDDLKIVRGARQPVDACDHQRPARMDEIEDDPELGTTREGGAVAGLGADHGASCVQNPVTFLIQISASRSPPTRCWRNLPLQCLAGAEGSTCFLQESGFEWLFTAAARHWA